MITESPTSTAPSEKEVSLLKKLVASHMILEALCFDHNVDLVDDGKHFILKLTKNSTNLLEFGGAIERYNLLSMLTPEKQKAYILDLSTVEYCA